MSDESHPQATSTSPREVLLWSLLLAVILGLTLTAVLRRPAAPPLPELFPVPDFTLTNRDGRTLSRADLIGSPWVADFIFTRCVAICPLMTERMKAAAARLGPDTPVRLVSFSVDPEHDTPEVLAGYAQRAGAGDNWYFLTGPRDTLHTLCRDGFKLAVDDNPPPELASPDEPIVHSNRFVLVDAAGLIRGYYNAFDPEEFERLFADLERL